MRSVLLLVQLLILCVVTCSANPRTWRKIRESSTLASPSSEISTPLHQSQSSNRNNAAWQERSWVKQDAPCATPCPSPATISLVTQLLFFTHMAAAVFGFWLGRSWSWEKDKQHLQLSATTILNKAVETVHNNGSAALDTCGLEGASCMPVAPALTEQPWLITEGCPQGAQGMQASPCTSQHAPCLQARVQSDSSNSHTSTPPAALDPVLHNISPQRHHTPSLTRSHSVSVAVTFPLPACVKSSMQCESRVPAGAEPVLLSGDVAHAEHSAAHTGAASNTAASNLALAPDNINTEGRCEVLLNGDGVAVVASPHAVSELLEGGGSNEQQQGQPHRLHQQDHCQPQHHHRYLEQQTHHQHLHRGEADQSQQEPHQGQQGSTEHACLSDSLTGAPSSTLRHVSSTEHTTHAHSGHHQPTLPYSNQQQSSLTALSRQPTDEFQLNKHQQHHNPQYHLHLTIDPDAINCMKAVMDRYISAFSQHYQETLQPVAQSIHQLSSASNRIANGFAEFISQGKLAKQQELCTRSLQFGFVVMLGVLLCACIVNGRLAHIANLSHTCISQGRSPWYSPKKWAASLMGRGSVLYRLGVALCVLDHIGSFAVGLIVLCVGAKFLLPIVLGALHTAWQVTIPVGLGAVGGYVGMQVVGLLGGVQEVWLLLFELWVGLGCVMYATEISSWKARAVLVLVLILALPAAIGWLPFCGSAFLAVGSMHSFLY